jgi:PrtD family type I secretion system ABC transporter
MSPRRSPPHPLQHALDEAKRSLAHVGVFSFFVNLLMLTGSVYMLQVYDRVLAARSPYTLLYLTLVAAGALLTMSALDVVRSRLLVRIGARFDRDLSPQVFSAVLVQGTNGQPFRDMHSLRTFLTGSSMLALLDVPWTPVFLVFVYLLHPMLGHVALIGGIALFVVGLVNEASTRGPLARAGSELATSTSFAEASARNAEVVRAMGMLPGLLRVWQRRNDAGLALQALASDRAATMTATAKFLRLFLQVGILGVGAYLVIREETTAGVMIAASIIMGRALAPVESAISTWRSILQARTAYARLRQSLTPLAGELDSMPLPAPRGELAADKLVGTPPGSTKPVINGVSFRLEAGKSLGITGPSAAGKSSLARLMAGVWAPTSGQVRLDGVSIADWRREEVGPYIGYLPQDIELFQGTVAENIARFGNVDGDEVVTAAQLAGAHRMILALPEGYDTVLGPGGQNLSGGQRQRIGLARAFYRVPPLIILDEPTSSLDAEGEAAVREALDELRSRGKTVIVIAHRPSLLSGVDALMVLQSGVITNFGPASEVLGQITRKPVTRLEAVNVPTAKG